MPSISDEDYNLLQYIKQQNAQGLAAGQNDWTNNVRPDGSLAGARVSQSLFYANKLDKTICGELGHSDLVAVIDRKGPHY